MTRYNVILEAFSFDTKEQAAAFMEALTDAFCAMPEAAGYAASARVEEVEEDE